MLVHALKNNRCAKGWLLYLTLVVQLNLEVCLFNSRSGALVLTSEFHNRIALCRSTKYFNKLFCHDSLFLFEMFKNGTTFDGNK